MRELAAPLAATGLGACLAAVNASAVQTLIVPDDGTLEDGGQVCPVRDGMSRIAARLRFPLAL